MSITAITSAAIVVILAVATILTVRGAPKLVEGDVPPANEPTGPDGAASLVPEMP